MSAYHEKQAPNDLRKAGYYYRGTRAGKKVQATKQSLMLVSKNVSKKMKSKVQEVQTSENNCSIKKNTAILLNAIARECTTTQSAMGECKNKPKDTSQCASKQKDGRPYRGKRAGKSVKVRQNVKNVAIMLSELSKEASKN